MVSNRSPTDRARSMAGSASKPVFGSAVAAQANARSSVTSGPRSVSRTST